jgi:Uma2 family endonuclease
MATPGLRAHGPESESDPLSPVRHRRFSVAEYHKMIDARIVGEDEHVELLEGEIVEMSPMRKPHARVTAKLDRWFQRNLGDEYSVRVQLPLTLRGSEPEPDVAIVRNQDAVTARRHPRSALLVVEVADTSVRYDLDVKARIYARARIPEYWLVTVQKKRVEVLRDIDPRKGAYRTRVTVPATGTLEPAAFPGLKMPVRALFD